MLIFARSEDKHIAGIPPEARIAIVVVKVRSVVVPIHVPDMLIAIRIYMRHTPSVPPPIDSRRIARLNII